MKNVTITEIDNHNKDFKEHCKSLSFQFNLNDILFNCIMIKDFANELGKPQFIFKCMNFSMKNIDNYWTPL